MVMKSRHAHWVCSHRVSRSLGLARIWRSLPGHKERARGRAPGPGTARDGCPSKTHWRAGGAAAVAHLVCGRLVGRRGAARLWHQGHQGGAALGGLCGPDCQGGAARRPAFRGRRAPRAHRQPQDGAGDWRHDPARGAQAGGPGHAMRGSATGSTIGSPALPNNRLQPTASSVRSCVAPASGSG